jgi:hypothetical protein
MCVRVAFDADLGDHIAPAGAVIVVDALHAVPVAAPRSLRCDAGDFRRALATRGVVRDPRQLAERAQTIEAGVAALLLGERRPAAPVGAVCLERRRQQQLIDVGQAGEVLHTGLSTRRDTPINAAVVLDRVAAEPVGPGGAQSRLAGALGLIDPTLSLQERLGLTSHLVTTLVSLAASAALSEVLVTDRAEVAAGAAPTGCQSQKEYNKEAHLPETDT